MKKLSEQQKKAIVTVLEHFHPESVNYGGWKIWVDKNEVDLDFILSEFKDTIGVEPDDMSLNKAYLFRLDGGKFKDAHTIKVLRYKADLYKTEADNLYSGIRKLIHQ